MNQVDLHRLPLLTNDADGRSVWSTWTAPDEPRGGMHLSPRIGTSSLRLRRSEPGYFAQPHVAGEPVLIVIQQGTLRIGLPDNAPRDFGPGDAFVAADRLADNTDFDPARHGHTAQVTGNTPLEAVHIKLTDATGF